jgi:hypothetical protein
VSPKLQRCGCAKPPTWATRLAARGQIDEALVWLRKVPLPATPGYREKAGQQLLQSAHPAFRAIGQQMLDSLAKPASNRAS